MIGNLEKRYNSFIENKLGMTESAFRTICDNENSIEFDNLLDVLANMECDVFLAHNGNERLSDEEKCAGDLIDLMCGPYDDE